MDPPRGLADRGLHRVLRLRPAPQQARCPRRLTPARGDAIGGPPRWILRLRPHGALPAPADRFFGRGEELDRLLRWLEGGDRLVTLVGLAGVGKTRLAVALAGRWPGPARWVDLAGARSADAVVGAVAEALGPDLADAGAVAAALRALGAVLIVLDAAEALDPGGRSALAALVAGAPEARFVATGLVPLRIRGERRLPLGPLAALDAEALLADRAPCEPDRIRELARDLDGLPLAIELAAARLRQFPADEVRRRLGEGLASDDADRPERHRSLAAAIEASAALLSDGARAALRRLAVFRGGFRLDAARAVLGDRATDLLGELVDATLVRFDAATGRYALPGPIAARAGPAAPDDRDRHAAHFARVAAATSSPDGIDPLDVPNLEAAFARAVERADAAVAGPVALALAAVLRRRGPVSAAVAVLEAAEGLAAEPWRARIRTALGAALRDVGGCEASARTLERVVATEEHPPEVLAEAWLELGWTHGQAGRAADAVAALAHAVGWARQADDGARIGRALGALGLAHADHDPVRAREAYREALAVARRVGDRACEGTVLSNLALLDRQQGRFADARAGFEAAVALHRALGHRRAEGRARCMLGAVHAEVGDLEAAEAAVSEALAVHREVGDRWYEAVATALLGQIALAAGDAYAAREHLERARAGYRELGHELAEAAAIGNLGMVRLTAGDPDGAREAFEQALAAARRGGDRAQIAAWLAALARTEAREAPRQARARLDEAEPVLRATGPRTELGVLLCVRAEVDAALGDPGSARLRLDEAAEMAAAMGIAPRSPLGAELSRVGALLDGRPRLRVADDGSRFALGAVEAELTRRHAIRRVLVALVAARRASPGQCVDVEQLFAAGWPGERAVPHAARERVYHAIGTLRRLGLGEVLERIEGGWRLHPDVPLDPLQ